MRYIKGESREQLMLMPPSLDDFIEKDNEVRSIDLFVDNLDLEAFGFRMKTTDEGLQDLPPIEFKKMKSA